MDLLRRFLAIDRGLATIEYVIGAAVVLGTLVAGVSAWNNGLVTRLQSLVSQLSGVRLPGDSVTRQASPRWRPP